MTGLDQLRLIKDMLTTTVARLPTDEFTVVFPNCFPTSMTRCQGVRLEYGRSWERNPFESNQ